MLVQGSKRLPAGVKVVLLADRGFIQTSAMSFVTAELGWHYRIRLKRDTWLWRNGKGWRQLQDVSAKDAFSIRRFVRGEGEADDAWLFLATTEADRAAMRPLLSLWADITSTALLSLPETHDGAKIWAVFDEVASLQRLPALPGLLERGRKHGAAVLLGLQAIPQLREAYGRDQAEAIAAQPQTWLVLRSVEPDTAKWLESAIGSEEVEEARTSLSMGVDAMRDGVSFQQNVTLRPLVLASEISTLPDLTGYLKLPGAPDLWRVAYPLKSRQDIAEPFVAKQRRRKAKRKSHPSGPTPSISEAGV